jgi:hypothetical protein
MEKKNYLLHYLVFALLFCLFSTELYAQTNTCVGAPLLTVSPVCVNSAYSVISTFTPSGTPISCGVDATNTIRDGWFSFVGNGNNVTITATTNRNLVLAVYSGTCVSLTEVGCTNAGGGNNQTETLTVLTTNGDTYFVRLIRRGNNLAATNDMDGNICITSPPANDECTGAFDLPAGQFDCVLGGVTNVGATYSNTFGGDPTCGGGIGSQDVWYKFIAPAGGQAVIDTEAGSITDSGMELYRSTDGTCGTLTFVDCDDNSGDGNMSRILNYNLVGGNTYYLRVWRKDGGEGTMRICIQNQYSDCDVAFPICSSTSFNTNSFGVGDEVTNIAGCFGNSDELETVWLTFTVQATGTLGFDIDPQSATDDDYDFVLYRANNTNFCDNIVANGTIVSCNASSSTAASGTTGINTATATGVVDNDTNPNSENPGPGNPYNDFVDAVAGDQYYLVVDNFNTTNIGFDISFSGTASLDCTLLPLEFTEFGGEKVKDQNLLHWATAREYNTSHFEIERSNNGMDFIKIGTLKSGNKKIENQIYQYWDQEPQTGINYYRLKQVDLDGTFTYTKTIAIDNQGIITSFEFQKIYPNPAQNLINFVFAVPASNSEIQIEVFDSNGKSVSKNTKNYQKGIQNFNQNLSSFSKGLYILRISNLKTGQILTEKFVKK